MVLRIVTRNQGDLESMPFDHKPALLRRDELGNHVFDVDIDVQFRSYYVDMLEHRAGVVNYEIVQ